MQEHMIAKQFNKRCDFQFIFEFHFFYYKKNSEVLSQNRKCFENINKIFRLQIGPYHKMS